MKSSVAKNLLVLFSVLALGLASKPASAFVTERDWQYIQSIGGMRLGQPQVKEGNWTLPVEIDVTGQTTITTKPTQSDSSLVCAGIQAEIHDTKIYLALFTSHPWLGSGGKCPPIVLGHLTPGKYTLYYNGLLEEPIKLADITIPQ